MHILLHDLAAFNSPVWFNVGFEASLNVGFEASRQCSTWFIPASSATWRSILDWNTKEGKIFRGGSGLRHQSFDASRLDGAAVKGPHRLETMSSRLRRGRLCGSSSLFRPPATLPFRGAVE